MTHTIIVTFRLLSGAITAAIRKLEHELGIKDELQPSDFIYLTRIHYTALSDDQWGENEIDHIFFVRKPVTINFNPNEVEAIEWVTADRLKEMFELQRADQLKLTPWFEMIARRFLFDWWTNIETILQQRGLNDPEVSSKIHFLTLDDAK